MTWKMCAKPSITSLNAGMEYVDCSPHPHPTSISAVLNLSCTLESPEETYKISGPQPGLIRTELLKVGPTLWHFSKLPG